MTISKYDAKRSKRMSFNDAQEMLLNGECTHIFRLDWLKNRETCFVYNIKNALYFSWMSEDNIKRYSSPLYSPENYIDSYEFKTNDWVCSTEPISTKIIKLKS